MIRPVLVKEDVDRWKSNPQELIAYMLELLWKADIKPSDSLSWSAKDGKITIMTHKKMIEEAKKKRVDGG